MKILFALFLFMTGCISYAPPVRIAHTGAPGKTGRHEVTGNLSPIIGDGFGFSGDSGIGITDKLRIDTGINGAAITSDYGQMMGYGGIRFVPLPLARQKHKVKFTFDMGIGGGMGAGGKNYIYDENADDDCGDGWFSPLDCKKSDGIPWSKRFAGGGYVDIGIGFNINRFDLFTRIMYQVTGAQNIPVTHWGSALIGIQVTSPNGMGGYWGLGGYFFNNDRDHNAFFMGEFGFVWKIGKKKNKSI